MSARSIDLLVVGGGPAGLVTALHAARAGWQVEVWERRPGVVDKACGEGLMPGALAELHALGIDPDGQPFRGIRYVAGHRSVSADFRRGAGRGIRRTTLHEALHDAASAAGVAVVHRALGDWEQDATGVRAEEVQARYLVAADGLHSPVRRRLGLETAPARHARFGLRRHYRVEPWAPYVEVHWAPRVEAYVTPVAPDEVGVALLVSSKGGYDARLSELPVLGGRLRSAAPVSDVRGAGPLRQGARCRVEGRVLLVGDAAGYLDALTGEGLALGFAQARAAVSAMLDGDPQRYERDWVRLTRRYRWLTGTLLAGTRPQLARRAVVPAARLLPGAFAGAVDALARPVGGRPGSAPDPPSTFGAESRARPRGV